MTGSIGGKRYSRRSVLSRCKEHWKGKIVLESSRRSAGSCLLGLSPGLRSETIRGGFPANSLTEGRVVECDEHTASADSPYSLRHHFHSLRQGYCGSFAHFPRTSVGAKPTRSSLIRSTSIRHPEGPQRSDPAPHRTSDYRS